MNKATIIALTTIVLLSLSAAANQENSLDEADKNDITRKKRQTAESTGDETAGNDGTNQDGGSGGGVETTLKGIYDEAKKLGEKAKNKAFEMLDRAKEQFNVAAKKAHEKWQQMTHQVQGFLSGLVGAGSGNNADSNVATQSPAEAQR